ncbi:MAG: glycoside hydrolase family 9 protein [Prevotella sp.]|nr:glycoside hydrolase family 9 protein [Prevotella sp.]
MKKTTAILAAALSLMCSCSLNQNTEYNKPFPLEPNLDNSLLAKWAKKEVLASKLIDDMEGDSLWSVGTGTAKISYTTENFKDGRRALRYQNSMLDSAYIASVRTPWGSFGGEQGGETFASIWFDTPQDWSQYNRVSAWVYIHPSKNPNVHFAIDINVDDDPDETLTPGREMNVDIPQGQWCNVLWDIDYMRRDKVRQLLFCQTNIGYDREMGEQNVTIDIDRIELQRVEPDNYSGWDIREGDFAFSHVGYRPDDKKVAITGAGKEDYFELLNEKGTIAYTGNVKEVNNKGNVFTALDFSDFREPGTYRIKFGDAVSRPFPIADDVWLHPMFSALNFYYCQRCGHKVEGIHSICHQDMQGVYGDEKKVINGGWHDAGDLSQGFWRTADGCIALMRCLDAVEGNGNLKKRIADEAAWGVEWLLKTRFADGRHISWATQRIYSDNVVGNYDDVVVQADWNAWENLQGTVVFLMAADKLKALSSKKKEMEEAAIDNWQKVVDSHTDWNNVGYQESAWGATASAMLYKRYGDEKYKKAALRYGRLLTETQEREFKEEIPITGYFYNDNAHNGIIRNSHAAFDEITMIAYSTLCQTFPEEKEWIDWYSGAAIYAEFFLKRGSGYTAPFNIVPNCVLRRADMEAMKPADGKPNYYLKQYEDGTQLNANYALRTFPVWDNYSFHGGNNCLLATSWALAEAATLVGDKAGLDLAKQQLEWIVGRNPFGQSMMYGVGYDFSPMFVYCTHNIVGAIPVGVDSYKADEPFWHGANYATYKEIWIEPVSRFLGTLSSYLSGMKRKAFANAIMTHEGNKVKIHIEGRGKHQLELRTYNVKTDFTTKEVKLSGKKDIEFGFSINDTGKPYVIVLIVDGDTEHTTTICGARH